jgi:hypothetical protein
MSEASLWWDIMHASITKLNSMASKTYRGGLISETVKPTTCHLHGFHHFSPGRLDASMKFDGHKTQPWLKQCTALSKLETEVTGTAWIFKPLRILGHHRVKKRGWCCWSCCLLLCLHNHEALLLTGNPTCEGKSNHEQPDGQFRIAVHYLD